ncbi:sodium-dependent glucose transporter 1 [Hoplias malabaricus]|uniref:sodium-dependent glucose transporter 1 n=1 Tax=Hoplias malabaricus TaxID=27720 RepID=UPI00346325CA
MAPGVGKKKRVRFARAEGKEPCKHGGGAWGRRLVTITLCGSFLGLGMCISVLGPTLEDLAKNVNKDLSNISYVFVGRASGYIGGSLVGGILFDILNPHLLLGFAMMVTSLGMILTPFCKKALLLTVLVSSVGVSMGILDTGGNVLILNTWGDEVGPHLQALHFSFAAGAFVSPIIAKLLFTVNGSANASVGSSAEVASFLTFFHSKGNETMPASMWAYVVIGAFVLLVSLLFFVLYSQNSGSSGNQASSLSPGKQQTAKHHVALIGLLSFFFFWYVGAEVAYGSFIFNFGKDYAKLPQAEAAGLNSLFWGSFAAFRGLAICFAACIYPGTMIVLSLLGCTAAALLLVLFSQHQVVLWSCTALYGASMATTFPSGVAWVEQYTVVNGRAAAVFVVGAALGEMTLPTALGFLLGQLLDRPLLMYLALITAIITSVLFPVMYILARSGGAVIRKPRGLQRGGDESDRQALLDGGGDEEAEPEEDAEQWNDADFEVIEMDDTPSPSKLSTSQPAAPPTHNAVGSRNVAAGDSPRRKGPLDREKND